MRSTATTKSQVTSKAVFFCIAGKCMFLSGLIPKPMCADDDYKLLDFGIGFTNIVERTTRGSANLSKKEIVAGKFIFWKQIFFILRKKIILVLLFVFRNFRDRSSAREIAQISAQNRRFQREGNLRNFQRTERFSFWQATGNAPRNGNSKSLGGLDCAAAVYWVRSYGIY